jgi:hypothetical protein
MEFVLGELLLEISMSSIWKKVKFPLELVFQSPLSLYFRWVEKRVLIEVCVKMPHYQQK